MTVIKMDSEKTLDVVIEQLKREELSPFCLNSCVENCCQFHHMYLDLNSKEFELLFSDEIKGSVLFKSLSRVFGSDLAYRVAGFSKAFSNYSFLKGSKVLAGRECPRYDPSTKECTVHDHPDRPSPCGDFPITDIKDNLVYSDLRCPFVKRHVNLIYDYIKERFGDEFHFILVEYPGREPEIRTYNPEMDRELFTTP